ncbi:protein of unknown function [uncultured Woeseiaceae bacterium]|uniref:Uncharacterized protein n=1 Tax=uncultured Woeseiaceae bacterium TaxID=1983305 RepID=A0A7D9D2C2_9GAMM|nr:protein of unknown function [uncultured Woeseiaceae bacterium]
MNNTQQSTLHPQYLNASPDHFVDASRVDEKLPGQSANERNHNHGLFHFFAELRRRRVCRALTMYSVAVWLICQIMEIVAPEIGLPNWTLKFVILLALFGLPIALILSWLFDLTPNGLVVESEDGTQVSAASVDTSSRPFDQVIDCSLVVAALVIGIQLAFGVLSTESTATQAYSQRIAVLPFRVASNNEAGVLSQGLVAELQHELFVNTQAVVIVPREPILEADCLSLTGAIAVNDDFIRVTATITDNKSGEITWSQIFQMPRSDAVIAPVKIAREIVAALPVSIAKLDDTEIYHAT